MANYTIHDLPATERPRERLIHQGVAALSTTELLAIVLGNGTRGSSVLHLAQELLASFGGIENLAEATVAELCQVRGIGKAKAVLIKAVFGLHQKMPAEKNDARQPIDSPWQAFQLLKNPYAFAHQEHFIIVMQDTRGCCIGHEVIAVGTLNETLVHPREVFYPAIRHKAASVLLAHNHPSGDPEPSPEDIEITEKLCSVGDLMDIPVLDHIILANHRFVSLRQKGIRCFGTGAPAE